MALPLKRILLLPHHIIQKLQVLDFIAPLAIRLYLAPLLWWTGTTKLHHIQKTAVWFGNSDWGLGLPFPHFMCYLTAGTELVGAVLLLLGLGVRYITPPLMFLMLVAAFLVHWDHGWLAIASHSAESSQRLQNLLGWLQHTYPNKYQFITELGRPVMLNNGVEFAITYFVMLLSLFFSGGGKYLSLDYYIARFTQKRQSPYGQCPYDSALPPIE